MSLPRRFSIFESASTRHAGRASGKFVHLENSLLVVRGMGHRLPAHQLAKWLDAASAQLIACTPLDRPNTTLFSRTTVRAVTPRSSESKESKFDRRRMNLRLSSSTPRSRPPIRPGIEASVGARHGKDGTHAMG